MLPFTVEFRPGAPPYEQVVYAVKKGVASGRLRPGDRFPSIRTLSQELRLNPNTVHKAVTALVQEGLLEVRPGQGTVVSRSPAPTAEQRRQLLQGEIEKLVVEARQLGLAWEDLIRALQQHWKRFSGGKP